jgi:hypothetical protein
MTGNILKISLLAIHAILWLPVQSCITIDQISISRALVTCLTSEVPG